MITCKQKALELLKKQQNKEPLTDYEKRNLRRAIRLLANGWAKPPQE